MFQHTVAAANIWQESSFIQIGQISLLWLAAGRGRLLLITMTMLLTCLPSLSKPARSSLRCMRELHFQPWVCLLSENWPIMDLDLAVRSGSIPDEVNFSLVEFPPAINIHYYPLYNNCFLSIIWWRLVTSIPGCKKICFKL